MDQVKLQNQALYHPSFFQSRSGRLSTAGNDDKWFNKTNKLNNSSNFTSPIARPGEQVYTRNDILSLKQTLKPMLLKSDNNTLNTLLFLGFFSENNVKVLHYLLITTVKKWSGYTIGKQSDTTLIQIMDTVYEKFAQNIDEFTPSKTYVNEFIGNEIQRLNSLVVDEAVPIIINGVEQHKSYIVQLEKPRILQNPKFESITGTKVYRSFDDLF
jgi:hypothetical protein